MAVQICDKNLMVMYEKQNAKKGGKTKMLTIFKDEESRFETYPKGLESGRAGVVFVPKKAGLPDKEIPPDKVNMPDRESLPGKVILGVQRRCVLPQRLRHHPKQNPSRDSRYRVCVYSWVLRFLLDLLCLGDIESLRLIIWTKKSK